MEMSKKQVEFFTIIICIAVVTATAILVIDFQIKGSILEQANNFRRQYEEWQSGQTGTATASKRSSNNGHNDSAYPSDLVGSGHAVVETAGDSNDDLEQGTAGTS